MSTEQVEHALGDHETVVVTVTTQQGCPPTFTIRETTTDTSVTLTRGELLDLATLIPVVVRSST